MKPGLLKLKNRCRVCARAATEGTVCARCAASIIGLEIWLGKPVELLSCPPRCVGVVVGYKLPDELCVLIRGGVIGTMIYYRVSSIREHVVCPRTAQCWAKDCSCTEVYYQLLEQNG